MDTKYINIDEWYYQMQYDNTDDGIKEEDE